MNQKIKDVLGGVLILVLLVVGYAAISYANSYGKSVYPPAFSVSGEGEVVAVPDIAKFSFGVVTQGGNDVAALQEDNTGKVNSAIEFLKSQGVEEEDIKTSQYNISPRYNFNDSRLVNGSRSDQIIGYTVTQSVEVTIRDFADIGTILSGVVENGANTVSDFRFTFDDPAEITNEARKQAIEDAKRKARLMAESGDFRIGRLLSIEESGFTPYPYKFGLGGSDMAFREEAVMSAPNLEPGSEEVMVNVILRYELKD